ncbi:hypothetical protein [Pseudomonas gingeri]|uniref:hypothetical protein n=1 Tax=Pseudomonas gingeri TaxID=117681 RepID=UPI003528AF0C
MAQHTAHPSNAVEQLGMIDRGSRILRQNSGLTRMRIDQKFIEQTQTGRLDYSVSHFCRSLTQAAQFTDCPTMGQYGFSMSPKNND